MIHKFKTEKGFTIYSKLGLGQTAENDIAIIDETNTMKVFHNGKWCDPKLTGGSTTMTTFEINQQIMAQMPPMSDEATEIAVQLIDDFVSQSNENFYMFLCKNQSYYTIFHKINKSNQEFTYLSEALFACCENIGEIKAIDANEYGAIEVWITLSPEVTDCYLLFPYESGVVEFGGKK